MSSVDLVLAIVFVLFIFYLLPSYSYLTHQDSPGDEIDLPRKRRSKLKMKFKLGGKSAKDKDHHKSDDLMSPKKFVYCFLLLSHAHRDKRTPLKYLPKTPSKEFQRVNDPFEVPVGYFWAWLV